MMSYYIIKRLFESVVVGAYRDIDDIHVVAANGTATPVAAVLELNHVDADGASRYAVRIPATVDPHRISRLLTLPSHYREVRDRTREAIHVELAVNGEVTSRDTLYFCPLSEVRAAGTVEVRGARSVGDGRWTMELEANALVKMVQLESAHRLLFSDNYFTLVPGRSRTIDVSLLDPYHGQTPMIAVAPLDGGDEVIVAMPA